MPANKPVSCLYFYGDYHRGANREECRLLGANPDNPIPWKRSHCDTCPVPEILITSNCRTLALEAEVRRYLMRERVEVTFAVCTRHLEQMEDPHFCPRCANGE